MDDARFDALARQFRTMTTRRAVSAAAGGIAVSLLRLGAPLEAEAKHHKHHKKPASGCLRVQTRCHGHETECCKGLQCTGVGWTPSVVCCSFDACKEKNDCCGSLPCRNGSCG
jgi:hypothetical protein